MVRMRAESIKVVWMVFKQDPLTGVKGGRTENGAQLPWQWPGPISLKLSIIHIQTGPPEGGQRDQYPSISSSFLLYRTPWRGSMRGSLCNCHISTMHHYIGFFHISSCSRPIQLSRRVVMSDPSLIAVLIKRQQGEPNPWIVAFTRS